MYIMSFTTDSVNRWNHLSDDEEGKRRKYKLQLKKYENISKAYDASTPDESNRLLQKIERLRRKLRKIEDALATSKSSSIKVKDLPDFLLNPKQIKRKDKAVRKMGRNSRLEKVFDSLSIASDEIQNDGTPESNFLTLESNTFSSLNLSDLTMIGIKKLGFKLMTPVQAKAIPFAMQGRDIMACAKTGSGKTLSFLIPAIELMNTLGFQPCLGTGVIIISPTKELALQIYGILNILAENCQFSIGIVIGGRNRLREAKQLENGVNILVATPGRLLDHLQNTEYFFRNRLKCLILDEADRILDIGFEKEMRIILRLLPKDRQTMFFSATLGGKTKTLADKAVNRDCVHVKVDSSTPERLKQYVIVCDPDRRFDVLFSFLKRVAKSKAMVFMSACKAVQYYHQVFEFAELPVFAIHGHQKLSTRTATFYSFREAKNGILICTDVAARGLDIPEVDWIIQFDPPVDPTEYIHRVGRTARAGASGEALLFLRPHEIGFLSVIKQMNIDTLEFNITWSEVANVQNLLKSLVATSESYHRLALQGYKSYVRSYAAYLLKDHFNVDRLELTSVAKSFGLEEVPLVDMKVYSSKKNRARHEFRRKLIWERK